MYLLLKEFSVPLKISELCFQVKNPLSSCRISAENKHAGLVDIGLVGALPVPHLVNDLVYLDFRVMDAYGGFDYLLVVMDALSRFVQFFPVSKHISGEQVLSLLFARWFQPFGVPSEVHSDNDVRFASSKGVYQSVLRALGCRVSFSSPRHPQGNSMVERMNRSVLQTFRILMSQLHTKNWPVLAPYVSFCINSCVHQASGFSPGELFLGRPLSFLTLRPDLDSGPSAQDWISEHLKIPEGVREVLLAKRKTKLLRANRRRISPAYHVGDHVLVKRSRFPQWPCKKLSSPFFGPFRVLCVKPSSFRAKSIPLPWFRV
jgi:hypothetical protein